MTNWSRQQNLIALHQARIIRSVLWDHNDQPREFTYHAEVDSIDNPIDVVNWQIADQTQIIQRSRKTQDHYPVIPVKLAIDRNREILIKLTNDQGQKVAISADLGLFGILLIISKSPQPIRPITIYSPKTQRVVLTKF